MPMPSEGGSPAETESNLTDRQQLIWIEQQLAPEVPSLNMVAVFRITSAGGVDPARFQAAFASVVARSDALRTVFERVGAGARQRVRDNLSPTSTWSTFRMRRRCGGG
jgi:hypothetical protein